LVGSEMCIRDSGGTGIDINQQGSVTNESTGKVQGGKGGDDSAGGGGVGGIGGTAVNITGSGSVENKGEFIGGDGGAGANANGTNANGGTGAQGGNGLAINGAGKVTNASGATILGGKGGTGGGGSQGDGGVGGKGGNGVLIGSGGTVVNDGTILGGTGNRGGGGGKSDGGAGGDGVHITTGGGTLSNSGTISGGSGGNAGTATGDAGAGGVGVYGSDMTIINSGTLEGGLNQDGTTRSQAVMFVSGTNSLELQAGYQVLGDVVAGSGDDTLILGGDKNSTFDAANIGDTAQYQGFDHFSKTGNSTWLLQNTTDAVTPWTIYEGILQVAQDGSLGAAGSTLTFDGGTLQMVGGFNFDSARPIVIDTAGGTLDTQGFDTTIAQGITGSGDFTKLGSGALTLTGDSTFSGETTLAEGSIDVTGSLAGAVTAHSGTALSGTGSVGSTTLDEGSTLTVGSKTEDDSALATFTINGALDNSGTVNLSRSQQQAGNQLQVNGDYKGGSNSQMNLSTVLGDDNSQTDHVAIQGSTSGTTWVSFTNVGGLGAQTNRGIEVISVDGSSASDAFKQAGRTVAGAWDYSLVQKGQNWYLTSVNTNPVTPIPQYRPEAGSYLINLAAANTIFNLSLDDREGATEYGTQKAMRSAPASTFWLRQEGGQNRFRAADGQIRTQANRYVAQMGNEFIHGSRHGDDRWGAGLMAGYGNVKGNASSSSTGYHSHSSMDGYSVGAYGTWYQNAQSRQGAYLDSWINYNWFKNQVNGEDLASEHYRSRGFTASLESGYNVLLKETQRQAVYLEPQAQLTWMGVKSPQHTEANGTQIQDNGHGNLQSRLGVRLYLRGHRTEDDGKNREFKPYIEADWLHNTHVAEIRMNDSLISQEGAKNVAQLKLGVQGQISPALNIWGGTGLQVGNDGYSDASAMVGMKYAF
ncbi:MAG: autotransporter outer membrane beta-barrel domain-containing protein, partial [Kluyvera cryocrescens]|nr:autotransporter outer membrane beta-barrel domain-containing protein [Kluyvera cryocrescens]